MNNRQEKILAAVIREYTNSAEPVGSKILKEKYKFSESSATLRNDMAQLEKDGWLFQPHTSAGRVPTDEGYRFFVEEIMEEKELTLREQQKLQAEVLKLRAQKSRMVRTMGKLLSSLSGSLVVSGTEKELHDFGIRELLTNPEFKEVDEFCKVVEALDYIDENVDSILKKIKKGETQIFIGKENPIKEISNCSMIVSPYKTEDGDKGLLAIIGPKRMKYAKNKSLLEYFKKILSGSTSVIILINFI